MCTCLQVHISVHRSGGRRLLYYSQPYWSRTHYCLVGWQWAQGSACLCLLVTVNLECMLPHLAFAGGSEPRSSHLPAGTSLTELSPQPCCFWWLWLTFALTVQGGGYPSLVLDGDSKDKLPPVYWNPQTTVHVPLKWLLPFMVRLHYSRPETANIPTFFYRRMVSILPSLVPSPDRELWAASCPLLSPTLLWSFSATASPLAFQSFLSSKSQVLPTPVLSPNHL